MLQGIQNKVLRNVVIASWFVRNADLHRDLEIEFVTNEIKRYSPKHEVRLHEHDNVVTTKLLDNTDMVRMLN